MSTILSMIGEHTVVRCLTISHMVNRNTGNTVKQIHYLLNLDLFFCKSDIYGSHSSYNFCKIQVWNSLANTNIDRHIIATY